MKKKYIVRLSKKERDELFEIVKKLRARRRKSKERRSWSRPMFVVRVGRTKELRRRFLVVCRPWSVCVSVW